MSLGYSLYVDTSILSVCLHVFIFSRINIVINYVDNLYISPLSLNFLVFREHPKLKPFDAH